MEHILFNAIIDEFKPEIPRNNGVLSKHLPPNPFQQSMAAEINQNTIDLFKQQRVYEVLTIWVIIDLLFPLAAFTTFLFGRV